MANLDERIIFTIGHSNRQLTDFIGLLQHHAATQVIDVRTMPRSRHNPQFNRETLPTALLQFNIDYSHLPNLGGLRYPQPNSPNKGWRNTSFRGYADYMQSTEFASSIDQLIALAKVQRGVLMCAEALPWRCHRSLIADALLIRDIQILDIIDAGAPRLHKLTPWAFIKGTTIHYPAQPDGPQMPLL